MISTRLSNILGYRKSHSCIHIHITNLIRDAHFFHERNIENNWINWTIVYLIEKFWFLSMMDSKMCRLYSKMNESQKLKKSLYFYQYRTKFTKLMPISILYRIDRETLSLLYCLLFVIRSLKIYFLISCILHLFFFNKMYDSQLIQIQIIERHPDMIHIRKSILQNDKKSSDIIILRIVSFFRLLYIFNYRYRNNIFSWNVFDIHKYFQIQFKIINFVWQNHI